MFLQDEQRKLQIGRKNVVHYLEQWASFGMEAKGNDEEKITDEKSASTTLQDNLQAVNSSLSKEFGTCAGVLIAQLC